MSRYTIFKHWIFNKDKKPYYVDDMGNILLGDINTLQKPDTQPASLQHAPTGWKTTEIKYVRNAKYLGMFRDFIVPLKFALDGAIILKELMWRSIDPSNGGFEAQSFYGLSKWDRYAFPPTYKNYFLSEIDLSKYKQSREAVEVTVLEGGVAKYLKAFEGTTYEIPIAGDAEVKSVYLDGKPFDNKLEYTIYEGQIFDGVASGYNLGMGIVVQEGSTQGILTQDQPGGVFNIIQPNEDWFLNSYNKDTTINITGTLNVTLNGDWAGIRFYKYTIVNGVSVAVQDYLPPGQPTGTGNHIVDINISIPVGPGDRLYAQIKGDTVNPGIDHQITGGVLNFQYEVTFDPTVNLALTPFRLFQLLTAKLTDNKYSCESLYLKSMTELLYTSGTALRGLEDSHIKISFNDFYQSLKQYGVMLFIKNDVLYIEQITEAYQSNIIVDLGVVSNLTIDVAEDKIYNTVKVGYPNQTYDNVNGLDEFNVTQNWTFPVLKITKELDLVSPVRADMTGIELQRLNLTGKTSTDSKSDNDTFFLSVLQGATILYYDGAFEVVGNVIRIAGTKDFVTGEEITVEGQGVHTVTNTSYLVVGFTYLTITPGIANGSYTGSIIYTSATVYKLNRPAYSPITGLLHPAEAFNIPLSPKQGLLNNGAFIRSFLQDPGSLIKYRSGEKNSLLSHTLAGVTLTQNEDIQVSNLGAPLFYPFYFEGECELNESIVDIMKVTPHGTVTLTNHNGDVLYGFLEDFSVKPATNDKIKFKLLCSPLTDLKLLAK